MPALVRLAVLALALLARALTRRRRAGAPGVRDLLAGRRLEDVIAQRAGAARARFAAVGHVVVRVVAWLGVIALAVGAVFVALVLYAVLGA